MLTIGLVLGFSMAVLAGPLPNVKRYNTEEDATKYLENFGYYDHLLRQGNEEIGEMAADEAVRKVQLQLALKKFQKFAGLPTTGILDEATKEMMGRRRCGVQDLRPLMKDVGGEYVWKKKFLTWTIDDYTNDLPKGDIRRAMYEAIDTWKQVSPLTFSEVSPETKNVDIRIGFGVGNHGDPWPFDGPDGILAHALYPTDGRTHFDDDEKWAYRDAEKLKKYEYSDLLSVAIHEFGHSLGMTHSDNPDAIMAPFYRHVQQGQQYQVPKLHPDDIDKIKLLYKGERPKIVSFTERPITRRPPTTTTLQTKKTTKATWSFRPPIKLPTFPSDKGSKCPSTIDAATKAFNGRSYIFSKSYVWEWTTHGLMQRQEIRELFPEGPAEVTAAYTNSRTQFTVLLSRRSVYGYLWNANIGKFELHPDFPILLTNKVPFIPETAFQWRDGNIVLMSGKDFVTYDEYWNLPTIVAKTETYFQNLPLDASTTLTSNDPEILLLFSNQNYYMYNVNKKQVVQGFPKTISEFLDC